MAKFLDADRKPQDVNLTEQGTMAIYRAAEENRQTLRQYLASTYPTHPDDPDVFTQMCLHAGLRFRKNDLTGVPASSLYDVLDPKATNTNQTGGSTISAPLVPDSRLLFPAAVMEAVNAAMTTKENEAMAAFEGCLAWTETIGSKRWEQPVISMDGKMGPEDSSWTRVGQNALPALMLGITAADVTRTIPTMAIGMQISQDALQATSLDILSRTLQHFYKKADYAEWVAWFAKILSGDDDAVNVPMATAKSALSSVTAASYDSGITSAGVMSQQAWLDILYADFLTMVPTHLICDINGAIAIDNRDDRPTNVQDNSTDRLDVPMNMVYPKFDGGIQTIALPTTAWTANTLMFFDKSEAIGKVISLAAQWEALEQVVMRKTTQLRFDRGYILLRLYDSAFRVITMTV